MAHAWACVFRDLRRDVDAVREHARTVVSMATERGTPRWQAMGEVFDGWLRAERDEGAAAIAQIEHGLETWGSVAAGGFRQYFLSLLARACLKSGLHDKGLRAIDKALAEAQATDQIVWEPDLHRLKGELCLAASPADVGGAIACFRRAIDVARRQQARSWELRATFSLARLLAAEGRRDEARRMLADVYGWFTEGFDTADLQEAKTFVADLC